MRHRAGTQRNAPLRGRTEALCRSEADRDAEKKQLVHGEGHRRVVNDSDGRWSQKVVVNLGRAESGVVGDTCTLFLRPFLRLLTELAADDVSLLLAAASAACAWLGAWPPCLLSSSYSAASL